MTKTHQQEAQPRSAKPRSSAKDAQDILDHIDWKAFTGRVIEKNTEEADAYEQARAKSKEQASRHVLV